MFDLVAGGYVHTGRTLSLSHKLSLNKKNLDLDLIWWPAVCSRRSPPPLLLASLLSAL